MPTLTLQLFGRFCASCNDRTFHGFDACKVQELLCYLLIYRKTHSRESLAAILWGDSSSAQSKKYLRQALWQLQTALESNLGPLQSRVILVDGDWVSLNPDLDLWLDVWVFEHAHALMHEMPNPQLDAESTKALHEAVELYRGDLLEGCYQDWCLCERERLQNMYLAMLDLLIRSCEANQKFEAGLAYAARVLRCDPARERSHRQVMRLYYGAGDRTTALRQYERCVLALEAELGVRPSARTVALYKQIQADQLELPQSSNKAHISPEPQTDLLPKVLDDLKEVRATLSAIQRRVQKDIHTVELALSHRR